MISDLRVALSCRLILTGDARARGNPNSVEARHGEELGYHTSECLW